MKNFFLFWPRLIKEIIYTFKYYRAVKSIQPMLEENGLRIDWIGRIYTVINLKEEFLNQQEFTQQAYIFQQLKPISDLLLQYGLSGDAYPEIEKISPMSYLVVLYPENEYLTLFNIFKNLLSTTGFLFLLYGIYELIFHFFTLEELLRPFTSV